MSSMTYKVEKIEKIKNKYNIYINDKIIEVSIDLIVTLQLYKDKVLDEAEFNALQEEALIDKYYLKSLNYLSYKLRSRNEIIEYLTKLGLTCQTKVLEKLSDYIDDQKLALLIKEECQRNLKGPAFFKDKLKKRMLDVNIEYDNEEEVLLNAIEKIKDNKKDYPVNKQKNLMTRKLLNDGFNMNLISKSIKTIEFVSTGSRLDNDFRKVSKKHYPLDSYQKMSKVKKSLLSKGYTLKEINEYLSIISID